MRRDGAARGRGPGETSLSAGVGASAVRRMSPLEQTRRRTAGAVSVSRGSEVESKKGTRRFTREEETLLQEMLTVEQDYIDSPEFRKDGAEQRIYDEAPDIRKPDTSWYHPVMDDISPSRTREYKSTEQVILTAAEERVLFLQYNYARHRIGELQKDVWGTPDRKPTADQAEEMLSWRRIADRLREQIANTNLALVLAMAKRTRMSEVDFADLVSEGNMALLRAVDKFDCGRGFKFSTYACRAILKAFSRQGMKLSKHRQRFPTDFDPKLEKSDYIERKREEFEKDAADEVRRIVVENSAELSDIEKTVISHRFGLDGEETDKTLTLEQVGRIIGVTKERVRQIQNKALEKIRLQLEVHYLGTMTPPTDENAEGVQVVSEVVTNPVSLN